MDFSKFDKTVDLEGLKADIEKVQENGMDFQEVPLGTYEVKVEKLELGESKKGDPMVKVWFRIINGEFENSMLFMNQVVTKAFQIHTVNELLRDMDTDLEIKFESYSQYNDLLMDVFEAVNDKMEFALEYGENKGYKTFKITEVFDTE